MQRINTVTIENAPEASRPVMENIKSAFGKVPNIFATMANSPATLSAMMGVFGALDGGELVGLPHEAIALRVGEIHGCKYCTAAHTAKAKMAGASEEETLDYRRGNSSNPKIQALLNFATTMVENRGELSDNDLENARNAGITDSQMCEVVAIVACNTFTNYFNALVNTEVDFPQAVEINANV